MSHEHPEKPCRLTKHFLALKQNTIVCLGTGTGKTFISASVIKEMQGGISGTYVTNGKRTFYLVNTGIHDNFYIIKFVHNNKSWFHCGDEDWERI